jgi:hypothetical protein
MILPLNPLPIGWSSMGQPESRKDASIRTARASASLAALSREFVLYTPALVHALTPFPNMLMDDYVRDCCETGAADGREAFELRLELTTRLTDVEGWEARIFAVPRDFWKEFETFVRSIFLQSENGKLCRFFINHHWIPEPGQPLLRVKLHYVGIDMIYRFCMLYREPDGVLRPRWIDHRQDATLEKFVAAILRGEENPQDFLGDQDGHHGNDQGDRRLAVDQRAEDSRGDSGILLP